MADSTKRTECVKVCLDERLFIDLGRLAAREDRKLADLLYVIVRRHMYGHVTPGPVSDEGTESD